MFFYEFCFSCGRKVRPGPTVCRCRVGEVGTGNVGGW